MFKFMRKPDEKKLEELQRHYSTLYNEKNLERAKTELKLIKSELVKSASDSSISILVSAGATIISIFIASFVQLSNIILSTNSNPDSSTLNSEQAISTLNSNQAISTLEKGLRFSIFTFAGLVVLSLILGNIYHTLKNNKQQVLKMEELVLEEIIKDIEVNLELNRKKAEEKKLANKAKKEEHEKRLAERRANLRLRANNITTLSNRKNNSK